MVVNSTDGTTVGMRKLAFNSIVRPFVFVHHGAELMSESVSAGKAFISYLPDNE